MATPRPYWTGQLRLSLVAIPVELYSATKSSTKIAFNQIHEPTGKRIHYEKVVPGIGPVDPADIMKGFQYEKGNYVLLTDEELDQVRLETRRTLELTQFVDACEIDPLYYDRPFFIVPQDELAEDAFRVIRDALRETNKVGLGQLALRGHEYIAAVKPCSTGLMMETLRYQDEVRKAAPYFKSISDAKADPDALDLARTLIERKSGPFDAAAFQDHYTNALRELIDRKLKSRGGKLEIEPEAERPSGANVVDLMAALKQSLSASETGGTKGGRKAPAKSAGRTGGRRKKSA